MKNLIFITVLTLFFHNGFSQDSRLTLGVEGSFDAYSVKYKASIPGISESTEFESFNGYSVGGRLEFYFSDKLTLRTGILYLIKGYKVDYNFLFVQPNDPAIPRTSTFKVGMINLPFLLGYQLVSWGDFKVTPALGMVIYGKIHENETTIYEDDSERKSDLAEPYSPTLSNTQFSAQFNLGLSYYFTDKVFVLFEPFFNYGFSGLNPTIEDGNPLMYGGILSVNYKL